MCVEAPGMLMQGKAEQSLHDYNARTLRIRAKDTRRQARERALSMQEQGRALIGGIRAAGAAQGIDLGSGVGADLQGDVAFTSSREQTRILNNAALEAWGYRVQARGEAFQGRLAKARGRFGAIASVARAAQSYSSGG